MFDAMFIGLSGMSAYSNGLRQVSNNITNLNSTGFRASTVKFNDLFSGGRNLVSYTGTDLQGDGVRLSDLQLDFSEGEIRQSGRDLDFAIDGGGFLVLQKDGENTYTRTGSFEINESGQVVLAGTDYKLASLDKTNSLKTLSIAGSRTNNPAPTTSIQFINNLSSTSTSEDPFIIEDVAVFNSSGEEDKWKIEFTRDQSSSGKWSVEVFNQAGSSLGEQELRIIEDVVNPDTKILSFEDTENDFKVDLDFSGDVRSFSEGDINTLQVEQVDGYALGNVTSIRVNEEGVLEIGYSNEQVKELGAVAIAEFREPQKLEQRSGGLFVYNSKSGYDFYTSDSERVGRVLSSRLEASNVDLSKEFGDLILVQRGYQASSQIVSVSNDMIQQLFGIRGQG